MLTDTGVINLSPCLSFGELIARFLHGFYSMLKLGNKKTGSCWPCGSWALYFVLMFFTQRGVRLLCGNDSRRWQK